MDKELKAAQRMAGILVFNTNNPVYIHWDETNLKFILSTESNNPDGLECMLIEKVTEEIVPCVETTVVKNN